MIRIELELTVNDEGVKDEDKPAYGWNMIEAIRTFIQNGRLPGVDLEFARVRREDP